MATKTAELREMEPDELESRLAEARQELFNLRFQHVTGQLDNYSRLGDVRREIARVNTILREKEIEAAEAPYEEVDEPEVAVAEVEGAAAARRARVLGSRRAAARAARQAAEEGREDA
jgi:large subunit ribosomal protein L29